MHTDCKIWYCGTLRYNIWINYESLVPDNFRFDFFFAISSISGLALQLTRPHTRGVGSGVSSGAGFRDIFCSSEHSEPSIKNRISLLFDSVGDSFRVLKLEILKSAVIYYANRNSPFYSFWHQVVQSYLFRSTFDGAHLFVPAHTWWKIFPYRVER